MIVDKVLFLTEKLKAIHMHALWTIHSKIHQYLCCSLHTDISLIQSTIESLIQKFSFPKILTILRNLRSIVISKISRHLQNTPLKKGLKFLERTFLQPIFFFSFYLQKKFTNNLPRDFQRFSFQVAVIFCYNCTRQIIMNDHNLSFV